MSSQALCVFQEDRGRELQFDPRIAREVHALSLGGIETESNRLEVLLQSGVGTLENTNVLTDRFAGSRDEVVIHICTQVDLVNCG